MGDLVDFVEDSFEFLYDVIDDTVNILIDAVTWSIEAIEWIIEEVIEGGCGMLGDLIDWVKENPVLAIIIVCALIFFIGPAIMAAYVNMSALASSSLGVGITTADIIMVGVHTFVLSLEATWVAFATAIHFTTLMSIHSVGMLISADYRKIATQIFYEISKVSSALGFSADFMSIMLMNTRNVVLDATTTFGIGYDLSEIQWIGELNKFLKRVSKYAHLYKDNPYLLMSDLQGLIQRPYADTKAEYMQTLFLSIDTILKTLTAHVINVDKTLKSTEKWFMDLYQMGDIEWAGKLGKRIGRLEEQFLTKVFVPLTLLENSFNVLTYEQKKLADKTNALKNRLILPGNYLSEVNNMSDALRHNQEDKIADISSRKYIRQIAETETFTQTEQTAHLGILAILDQIVAPVEWLVPELATPIRPASVAATPRKTWFVGDF